MRTVVVLFCLAIAAAVGGTVMLRPQASANTDLSVSVSVPNADRVAPVPVVEEVAVGDDETAAIDAALRATTMTGDFVTAGHFSRRDLVRSIATDRFAPSLIDDSSAAIVDFQFEVDTSDGFWLIQQPLTAHSNVTAAGRVEVTVWSVVVVASTEFGVGRETWQTSSLEMLLVDGSWLVDEWVTVPGPAPAPSADLVFAGPAELGDAMSYPQVLSLHGSND